MEFEECVISPIPLCEMTHFRLERYRNNPPFMFATERTTGAFNSSDHAIFMTLSFRRNLFSAYFSGAEDFSYQRVMLSCWRLQSTGRYLWRDYEITAFTLSSLVILLVPLPAAAVDLTGIWTGRFNCTGFDGKKFLSRRKARA